MNSKTSLHNQSIKNFEIRKYTKKKKKYIIYTWCKRYYINDKKIFFVTYKTCYC